MTAQVRSTDRVFFDLSARAKFKLTGSDRVRFLNGQITNDIRKATEVRAIEACVLNAKGKLEAHLFVHAHGDAFLIDADPGLQPSLQARLERYVIADDVEIADVTAQSSILHVINAQPAISVASQIISADRFSSEGYDIWCDSSEHDQIVRELTGEFRYCDNECAEILRIEQGIPRWGRELTHEIIPVEANLEQRCIDYDKGCYIGQETISRMKMSGQRNKQLCGLVSLTGAALAPGTRLVAGPEDKDVGWITSAGQSNQREIALGFVKRGFNSVGSRIDSVSSEHPRVPVEIVDVPFQGAKSPPSR
jgi:tRNA-modifying protein YgfZ